MNTPPISIKNMGNLKVAAQGFLFVGALFTIATLGGVIQSFREGHPSIGMYFIGSDVALLSIGLLLMGIHHKWKKELPPKN